MKSSIARITEIEPFPALMEYNSGGITFIVLFHDKNGGQVVYTNSDVRSLGEYCADWEITLFKPFTGKVTITT